MTKMCETVCIGGGLLLKKTAAAAALCTCSPYILWSSLRGKKGKFWKFEKSFGGSVSSSTFLFFSPRNICNFLMQPLQNLASASLRPLSWPRGLWKSQICIKGSSAYIYTFFVLYYCGGGGYGLLQQASSGGIWLFMRALYSFANFGV